MLKEKDLKEEVIGEMPIGANNTGLPYDDLEWRVRNYATKEGLPLDVKRDEIKLGGLLKNTTSQCLVLTNTEHPDDYYQICTLINGRSLSAYFVGNSKQYGLIEKQEKARDNRGKRAGKEARRWRGNGVFGGIAATLGSAAVNAGSMAMSGLRALQRDNNALDLEDDYYARCLEILKAAVRQ